VREALCELELPYLLRNAGKGSSLRPALLQLAGSTQVPYLVDPNTGVRMAESKDIIPYLFKTYGPVSA
jgi:anaphase-promoting complex subunit 7